MPFPLAVDDHQTVNARFLSSVGAAILLPQAEMTPEAISLIRNYSRGQLLQMAEKARARAKPDAAAEVARVCEEIDVAPKFYPVLSSLQRFWVAVFGAVAAGCGAEPFRLRSTASRRGLMVWANSAGVSQPRPECGR